MLECNAIMGIMDNSAETRYIQQRAVVVGRRGQEMLLPDMSLDLVCIDRLINVRSLFLFGQKKDWHTICMLIISGDHSKITTNQHTPSWPIRRGLLGKLAFVVGYFIIRTDIIHSQIMLM